MYTDNGNRLCFVSFLVAPLLLHAPRLQGLFFSVSILDSDCWMTDPRMMLQLRKLLLVLEMGACCIDKQSKGRGTDGREAVLDV